MKTFKKYLEQLDETLSPKQRKWIDNRTPYDQGREHNELFRNPPEGATKIDDHSFTIPLAPVDRTRENEISDHLSQHGYTIHDYVNDHVTDKHGRTASIGKALGKTKKDPNLYASDPRVRARNSGELSGDTHEILISRHPYHIGGMSTDRDWNSCMTLPGDARNPYGGQYRKKVQHDLEHGTLIAYLTKKGTAKPDTELERHEALSRILLKKFESPEGHAVWRAENNSYSPSVHSSSSRGKYPQFEDATKKFGEETWKENPDQIYFKHPKLYNDDGVTTVDKSKFEDYDPKKLESYRKHIENLEDSYDRAEEGLDEPIKDYQNLHRHRMKIAEHPNVSNETLSRLIPDDENSGRYEKYDDRHWNDYGGKSDLLYAIMSHKNASPTTIMDALKQSDGDDDHHELASERILNHPDSDDEHLEEFKHNEYLHHAIASHKNANDDTLAHIYSDRTKNYGDYDDDKAVIEKVAHHKNTNNDTHNEMLDDIESGEDVYNDEFTKHHVMKGIAKNSTNPETLHRLAQMTDHHDIQNHISRNKNTETHTLQHIMDNLSTSYPELEGKNSPYVNKEIEGQRGVHIYDPRDKKWYHQFTHHGDLVDEPVDPATHRKLSKKHKNDMEISDAAHNRFMSGSQGKIMRNIAMHPNTSMAQLQDIGDSSHTTGSMLARNRLSKNRMNRLI